MENKSKKNNNEDTTTSGEFISSFFSWVTLEEQKENAIKLEKMTKNEKNK